MIGIRQAIPRRRSRSVLGLIPALKAGVALIEGASLGQLCRRWHCSYPTLRAALREILPAAQLRDLMRRNLAMGSLRRARRWTSAEIGLIRRDYRRRPARQIAADLGVTVHRVYAKAVRLGLSITPRAATMDDLEQYIRARHNEGWSDNDIAGSRGIDRQTVRLRRHRLGLASNAFNERHRAKIRANTTKQLRAVGCHNFGQYRARIYRQRAIAAGWPEDLRWQSVRVLNLLWDRGPLTRRQLCEYLDKPWKGSRHSLTSNDPEGTTLAHLMRRGLVVSLGRVVRTGRHGGNVHVYSLPISIQRRIPSAGTQATG